MPFLSNLEYSRVPMARRECRRISFEDDALDAGDRPNTSLLGKHNFDKPTSKSTLIYYLSRTLILMVSLASIMLFVMGLQWRLGANKQCLAMHSTYSPALKDIDPTYRRVKFSGTLDYPSIYRGDPSPEIDAAWDNLENVRVTSITEEEVLKIGKTTDAIKIPSQFGGGYMASVEVNHQLHCLNFLRKSLVPAYYAPPSHHASVEFTDQPSMIATHQGHCIEMLRQFVMCHADVGTITHRWVKDYPRPYPDFNTWHQCRNFDDVLQWTKEKQFEEANGGPPEGWKYVPADGEVILDAPP